METVEAGWTLPRELRELAEGGDESVVEELIAMFKDDVGERLEGLRHSIRAHDFSAISTQAHSIKGSALQMGAGNLMALCRHIELDASHHIPQNLDHLFAETLREFERLKLAMRFTCGGE